MIYRIDETKCNENIIHHVIWCLEEIYEYDVYYDKEKFMLTIKW